MQADLPHTLYSHRRGKAGKGKKGQNGLENYKYNPNDKAIRLQEEANRRSRERMAKQGEQVQYTMEEIFNR